MKLYATGMVMSDGIKGTSNQNPTTSYVERRVEKKAEEMGLELSEPPSESERVKEDGGVVMGVRDQWEGTQVESKYMALMERGQEQGLEGRELADKIEGSISAGMLAMGHGEEVFDVETSRAARAFGDLGERLASRDELYSNTVQSQVSTTIGDRNMNRAEIVELMAHPDQFRAHLRETTGDYELADEIFDEVADVAMRRTTRSILSRAESSLNEAMGHLEQLNASSDSRRAFLAGVAAQANSPEEIAEALQNFGISRSDTADMAETLDEIRTNEDMRQAFLDGDSGTEVQRMGFSRGGTFDVLEATLESNLDDAYEGMERLVRDLGNQHTRGNAELLTEDLIAPIRDEVLAELGAVTSPPEEVNELGQFYLDGIEGFEHAEKWQGRRIAAINITASIGVTVLTGGAGAAAIAAGLTTSGMQSTISISDAQLDTVMARGAVNAQLADPELLARAERDENVAFALAAADMLTVGVAGGAGNTTADVVGEASGAGLEAYGAER